MAKPVKPAKSQVERMRAAFSEGNVREARILATSLLGEEGAQGSREEAERLLAQTEIDKRAIAIGGGALLMGLFYTFRFLLLG